MGAELTCRATWKKQSAVGKALLETTEILFRGDFRLKIPFATITGLQANDGNLVVKFPDGPATFEIGDAAEKWRFKILNPRTLMDKLGVKAGLRVNLDGISDPDFLRELDARKPASAKSECDIVFFGASTQAALRRLPGMQARIKSNGAIWVIYPKGRKEITEIGVIRAGREAGFVDVKIASVSATLTGTKLMIPVAKRGG